LFYFVDVKEKFRRDLGYLKHWEKNSNTFDICSLIYEQDRNKSGKIYIF